VQALTKVRATNQQFGETVSPQSNWELTKSLLTDRIRRRFVALQRLSNAPPDTEAIDHEIDTCGDDAKSLWALAERVDRALDLAMSPRASRIPIRDSVPDRSNDEFRSR
jgi:hypothetical protein